MSYAVCIYVLIKRRDDRSSSATWYVGQTPTEQQLHLVFVKHRILSGASTVQFILATIHAAVTLRLLIEGFIHTENIPNGAFLYWINPASKSQVIAKTVYITNVKKIAPFVRIPLSSDIFCRPFLPTVCLYGVHT